MIDITGLAIRLGDFALKDISLKVKDGESLTIIGPNGSGKTTLLGCITGLLRPSGGRIDIDDVEVTNLPPEKRGIGYVPQDYALFPHLTADKNVAFGLRNSTGKHSDEARKIMRWLGIEHLVSRDVQTLSAGERQKVALARALALNPKALLLDEPLSALDPLAREKLRRELKSLLTKILNTLDLPVIHVTHDLLEAQIMSDQLAVMNKGRIEQAASKDEVFENPRTQFVAEFLGYNTFNGKIITTKEGLAKVDVEGIVIRTDASDFIPNEHVTVLLRPEDIFLSLNGEVTKPRWHQCQCNIVQGMVTEVCKMGPTARILVDAGIQLKPEVGVDLLDELGITLGSKVFTQFKASKVKLISK